MNNIKSHPQNYNRSFIHGKGNQIINSRIHKDGIFKNIGIKINGSNRELDLINKQLRGLFKNEHENIFDFDSMNIGSPKF